MKEFICFTCGKIFYDYHIRKNKKNFCSSKCFGSFKKIHDDDFIENLDLMSYVFSIRGMAEELGINRSTLNNIIYKNNLCSNNLGNTGKHNSLLEYKLLQSKQKSGNKNPAYKGENGTCFIRKNTIKSFDYSNWRKKVFERDNYSCQICGKRDGKICAHHIKPYSKFPNLRLSIDNGQTLCYECHRKTDSYLNPRC